MPTFGPLTCPLPECGHRLHLTWTSTHALYADDLQKPPVPGVEVETMHWQVECEDGHVLLLPDSATRERCGDDCTCPDGCDVDSDDDYHTFRLHDAGRLADLLAAVLP